MPAGQRIKVKSKDNKEFSAYLCLPPSDKGPGLLLIQEVFGVNSHIKDVAELYAQEGFVVLAPDLFWRSQPDIQLTYNDKDLAKGIELAGKLDMNQAIADLAEAINTLKKTDAVAGKIGAVGYCFGGNIAYRLACRGLVDASVSYYGGGINNALDEAKNLNSPLLMHFAELDDYIPASAIEKISAAMANKTNVIIHKYAGVHHGFNCDQRGAYNRQAAMLAYSRSAAFLHKHLN